MKINRSVVSIILLSSIPVLLLGCNMFNQNNANLQDDNFNKARSYYNDKEYSKAIEAYKLSINAAPGNTDAYIEASDIYILKGDRNGALELLTKGKDSANDKDKILFTEGKIFFNAQEYEQAASSLEQARDINKSYVQNNLYLARTYVNLGRNDEAVNILKDSNSDNKSEEVSRNFLLALLSYDDLNKAKEYIQSAENGAEGETLDAIKSYKEAVKLAEDNNGDKVYTNTILAYQLMKNDLFKAAIPLAEQSVKLNDEHWAGFMYLGISHLKMKNYDDALNALKQGYSINPDQKELSYLLAQVYTWQNNQQEAIDAFERALSIDSKDEVIRYDYAKSLVKFNLNSQAAVQLDMLVTAKTGSFANYKLELANLYLDKLKTYDKARDLTKELIEQWDGFKNADSEFKSRIYDSYGWALENLSERDTAKNMIEKSLEFNQNNPSAHYHLGYIQRELTQFNDAKTSLERAIDLDTEGSISKLSQTELDKI